MDRWSVHLPFSLPVHLFFPPPVILSLSISLLSVHCPSIPPPPYCPLSCLPLCPFVPVCVRQCVFVCGFLQQPLIWDRTWWLQALHSSGTFLPPSSVALSRPGSKAVLAACATVAHGRTHPSTDSSRLFFPIGVQVFI